MHDHRGRNGVFNLPSADGRNLGLSDIAAARALYGFSGESSDECCGKITGKIETKVVRTNKKTIVWAEESETDGSRRKLTCLTTEIFRLKACPPENTNFLSN